MEFEPTKPDPRILVIKVIIVSFLAFSFNNWVALLALFIILDMLILLNRGVRIFFKNLFVYLGIIVLFFSLSKLEIPIISNVFCPFLMLLVRVYPVYTVGRFFMMKVQMNELLTALSLLHIPNIVLIPIAVIYRYIPTLQREIKYVNENLKMRGMTESFFHVMRHPVCTVENYLVPLIFRSEMITEELSAASLCKGLNSERKRSCSVLVKIDVVDAGYLFAMIVASVLLTYVNENVIL